MPITMSATNPGASAQGFGAPQAVARVVSLLPSTFHFIPRHRPLCRGTRGGSWPLAVCPTHATASSSCTIGTYLRAASRRDCDGLSRDRDHDLLDLAGTYGDPNAGDPIQYDGLRLKHEQGDVEIVYNRAIPLFTAESEAARRIQQVCCRA